MYLGIDPGKKGGLAVLDNEGRVSTTRPFPMNGDHFDYRELAWFVHTYHEDAISQEITFSIAVEDPGPVVMMKGRSTGVSAQNNFAFGRAVELAQCVGPLLGIRTRYVKPKDWQHVLLKATELSRRPKDWHPPMAEMTAKDVTLAAIQKLYPDVDLRASKLARTPHDGITDAIGIAYWLYSLDKDLRKADG